MTTASRQRRIEALRRHMEALAPPPQPLTDTVFADPDASARTPSGTPASGPLSLPPGLHETCPASYLDTPAAFAFQAGLLAGLDTSRPVVWAQLREGRAHDFGRPCPHGLKRMGVDPGRILLTETDSAQQALWAMEEGLRAGALVFGDIGEAAAYDLTASKRLVLAAREKGLSVLILRAHGPAGLSAALTRWRVAAEKSPPAPWRGASGLPGLTAPRFRAVLERVRGGAPKTLSLEWKDAAFHRLEPAALADRPAVRAARAV
jgi:protein ImuA